MARKAPFKERMTRRASVMGGRARRSWPGSAPRHRSLFFHMPKCGGTSLSEAMYATVPFNERIGVLDAVATRRAAAMMNFDRDDAWVCHEDLEHGQMTFDLREGLMLQHMAWDTMLIHGHVLWSERAQRHFGEVYKYVTLLRDPVARTVSNFRMTRRSGVVTEDLDAYLEGPVARRHARVYLRYLAGRNDIAEDEVPEALELAKERLSRFALIGFLDETPEFILKYRALFGVQLRMSQLNAAPDSQPGHSEAQMRRLTELCAPDIALYDHARTLVRP